MWCCTRDEGLALRSRPAGGGFKPPHAALAEDRRGERWGKGVVGGVRWGLGRRPLLKHRNSSDDIETGVWCELRDELGRCPLMGQVVSGVEGGVSPVCCSRAEREKACPDTAAGQRAARGSASRARGDPGAGGDVSTVAGRAGGPARSSGEALVMGVERRGRVVRGCVRSSNWAYAQEETYGQAEVVW